MFREERRMLQGARDNLLEDYMIQKSSKIIWEQLLKFLISCISNRISYRIIKQYAVRTFL